MNALVFVLAQETNPATSPPVVAGAQLESVWDFIVKGGPTMVAIALCSLIAMAVIVERMVVLRRGRIVPPAFIAGLKGVWRDRERAMAYCQANASPAARVLEAALKR